MRKMHSGRFSTSEWYNDSEARSADSARFRSVISVASPAGALELFDGACEGMIALEPRGVAGFGYDPVFYVPSLSRVMAELSLEEKNGISHRGIAARKAVEYLKGVAANV